MATLQSYQTVGLAEDVSQSIASISPSTTPFQTLIKSEKVSARTFEWLEDTLRSGSATNTLAEGGDASVTAVSQPTVRDNRTQIISEAFKIAGTVDAVWNFPGDFYDEIGFDIYNPAGTLLYSASAGEEAGELAISYCI